MKQVGEGDDRSVRQAADGSVTERSEDKMKVP